MGDVRSLPDWLDEARKRPGMFVRGKSLAELESQCTGWQAALAAHGIDEPGAGFNPAFRDWLRTEHRMSVARGWADAIRRGAASDDEAWGRFFTLLEAFRASRRRAS
jgi:hypothetical protein